MSKGSNRVKKAMTNIAAAAISSLVSMTVLASPKQLDILGLIPGISEITQVQQVSVNQDIELETFVKDDPDRKHVLLRLKIGGHVMPCSIIFLNDKLTRLDCFTGNDNGHQRTEASNIEVHSTLTDGFTKKFGKPDSKTGTTVRTANGVVYEKKFVIWKDKQGNELELESMFNTVDTGHITLNSSEYLKQAAKKDAAAEAQKKF